MSIMGGKAKLQPARHKRPQPRLAVVAAVIRRGGLILIGQRPRASRHGLKWEFPGGKVEAGENPREAIERELQEELAIQARIGDELTRYEYRYPNRQPIQLIFYGVDDFDGEPQNLAFEQILWEPAERLPDYDFLEADVEFIRGLRRK
jgi:8-oxo-dGTP diphosphatase